MAYWPVLLILLAGTVADAATTYANLHAYGAEVELHPAHRLVSMVLGVTVGVPVGKAMQLGFVVLVACWWRPWCGWMLGLCGVLYGLAAMSNHCHWL